MNDKAQVEIKEETVTEEQRQYRAYLDSGQIVKLNSLTGERRAIYPKELLNAIRQGNLPPFWNEKPVLDLLEEVLPSAHYPRTNS